MKGRGATLGAAQGLLASFVLAVAGVLMPGAAYGVLESASEVLFSMALATMAVILTWNLPGIMRAALERGEPDDRPRSYEEELRSVYGLSSAGMEAAVRRRTAEYEQQWAPLLAARDGHLGSSAWLSAGASMADVKATWPKFIQLPSGSSGVMSMGVPPRLRYPGPPQVHTGPHQVVPHVTCAGCQRPLEPELGEDGSLTFRCGPCLREATVTAQQARWPARPGIRVTLAGGTAAFSEALPCPCCGASVTSMIMRDGVILGCRNCTQQ